MPAAVTYQIKGKYDNKATKAAQADLTKLASSLKGLGLAAWAKIGATAVKGLNTVMSGTVESFNAQNKAAKNLEQTIKKSNKDFSELVKHQEKLSKNNFFDNDSINNAEAMAINMGLAQDQIINVMEAAADLAASGIMPLDQAVKSLSLSYSGNTTALSKYVPQVKNLTKEQLANGDAVSIVAKQYKGLADAMAGTYSGKATQFKNTFSDLQAALGSLASPIKYIGQDKLIPVMNQITNWIKDNRNYILNTILNLPELAKLSLNLISSMIAKTFTGDTLLKVLIALGKTANDMIKDTFTYLGSLADSFAVIFVNIITDLADTIKTVLGNSFNFVAGNFNNALLDGLVDFIGFMAKIANYIVNPKQLLIDGGQKLALEIVKAKKITDLEKNNGLDTQDINKKYFEQIASNTSDFTKNYAKNLAELGSNIITNYTEEIESFKDEAGKLINKDLPAAIVKAETQLGNNDVTGSFFGSSDSTPDWFNKLSEMFNNGLSDIQGLDASISEGLAGAAELDPVIGVIIKIASEFENVLNLMAPIKTIFESFIDTLAPVVNEILAPLVGALKMVGQILAQMLIPLLQALTPVISFLAEMAVWLYNKVILPVANGIITVFVFIKNGITNIVNGLIYAVNSALGWLGVRIGYLSTANASDYYLQALNTEALTAAGSASSATTTGGASNFTAARDLYVNINFSNSFVNGDAEAIAIMLRDEIARAERLGY